jgi:hypothetical protein
MKEFNKEEYNKICAEFLGWKEDFAHESDKYGYIQTIDGHITPFINLGGHESNRSMYIHSISQLKFDLDWNWIMEVVNKIKPIVSMSKTRPLKDYNTDLRYALISAKKEVIVQAIWEFLNWHKENKK